MLRPNRSMANAALMPELSYPDVLAATAWLCAAFGCVERLRIGNHRVQLTLGTGALIVTQRPASDPTSSATASARCSLLVRVTAIDAHHAHALKHGAHILRPPADYPYGERQYTAEDLGGHTWTFSETIADVDPGTWGGVLSAP